MDKKPQSHFLSIETLHWVYYPVPVHFALRLLPSADGSSIILRLLRYAPFYIVSGFANRKRESILVGTRSDAVTLVC